MESQIQATVVSVTSRTAKRKSDNQQFTLYDVKLSDGETYTTTKREVAEQAHALTGQLSLVTIKVEQNGQWTNRYLQSIGGTMGAAQPTWTAPANGATTTLIPDTSAQHDAKIHRQTAAKVAAHLSSTSEEFWANLDDLVAYFETGNKPQTTFVPQPAAAAAAPASGIPAASQDDDIPF